MCYKERAHRVMLVSVILFCLIACSVPGTSAPEPPVAATTAVPPTTAPIPPTLTPTPIPPTLTPPPVPETPTLKLVLATSAEEILGVWAGAGIEGMYKRFNEDGTCLEAISRQYLDTNPTVDCEYRFDGTHLILTEVKVHGVPSCNPKSGIYEVQVLAQDKIKFVTIQDSCRLRIRSMAVEHARVP